MHEVLSGFPVLPFGRPKLRGLDFKAEFGRKEGKHLSKDLFEILNSPEASYDENLVYSIPISLSIFKKHNHGKRAEDWVKQTLLTSIQGIVNSVSSESTVPSTRRFTQELDFLSFYVSSFGDYPLSNVQKQRILSIAKEAIQQELLTGDLLKAAEFAHNYLLLGGEVFWPEESTEKMLKRTRLALLGCWDIHRRVRQSSNSAFLLNFPNYAFIYSGLKKRL